MAIVLQARGLCKTFGAVTAAAEVSAAIEKDSVVGLIGTNGAGKTTFINMITGYLKPDRGTIAYEGRDITRLPPRAITRLGICRSFQIPQLYGSLSVFDNMMIGIGIVLRNAGLAGYFSRGTPLVGSSSSRMRGFATMVSAMSSSLRTPPGSPCAFWSR